MSDRPTPDAERPEDRGAARERVPHPIRLRNSATGKKARLIPRDWRDPAVAVEARKVRMYVCGPTVYDRAHIGNARPAVVFDVLARLLRHVYGDDHVVYVRNLTDVEDKINARAAELYPKMDPLAAIARLTAETTGWYHEDMAALGVLPPTHEPRATEHVPGMVDMIARLVASGHAYAAEGHVLFAVESFADYGKLSGRSTDDMIAGARVEVAPYKRHPMDFVLWKPSTPEQPGWESPWGRGRPGWHIECSAMAEALLGKDFDIHGGGSDLMFPHHENEVAQSMCAHPGHGFAEVWLHNGMIRVEGRKMSKSLGNFTTVADLRGEVPGEVIRLALLSTHYRAELDWTEKLWKDMKSALSRWLTAIDEHESAGKLSEASLPQEVFLPLTDDINTPQAIAALHLLHKSSRINELNAALVFLNLRPDDPSLWLARHGRAHVLFVQPLHAQASLGPVSLRTGEVSLTGNETDEAVTKKINALVEERKRARDSLDFERADAIRDAIQSIGVIIRDSPHGTTWQLGPDFDAAKLEGVA